MAFGPVGGGWLFDQFGDYSWLYLSSAAIGLAAAAVALGFPRPESTDTRAVPVPA
jgi:MFS family permease